MSSPANQPAILLAAAEDYGFMARVFRVFLPGWEVVWTNCGHEALKLANKRRFRVIVADVALPKVDGLMLHLILSTQELLSATRFIALVERPGSPHLRSIYAQRIEYDDVCCRPQRIKESIALVNVVNRAAHAH